MRSEADAEAKTLTLTLGLGLELTLQSSPQNKSAQRASSLIEANVALSAALIDANAALGSVQSAAVGGCDPDRECENGAEFHKILRQQRLFLPSTFSLFRSWESHTLHRPTGACVRRVTWLSLLR